MKSFLAFALISTFSPGIISAQSTSELIYSSEDLKISKLTANVFLCVSYLDLPDAKVACNGMLYVAEDRVYVFDTPSKNEVSNELIDFIENDWQKKVAGVIVNHFHADAVGGLEAFHKKGIPSYGSKLTQKLCQDMNKPAPQFTFTDRLELENGAIQNRYLGEAHSSDNIVSYLTSERILFGGCMVKSLGAGEGNLNDANVGQWPRTVQKIKSEFPILKHVVPGHGATGDVKLLDYTIGLLENK